MGCLLSWAGQRVPIYFLYTVCHSLGCHRLTPAAPFLASFDALRKRKGAPDA